MKTIFMWIILITVMNATIALAGIDNHLIVNDLFASQSGPVLISTSEGLFVSHDSGATWDKLNHFPELECNKIWQDGERLFATTLHNVLVSYDEGDSWKEIFSDHTIDTLFIQNHTVYIGCDDGIYMSNDLAQWTKINTPAQSFPRVQRLAIDGSTLYVGSDEGRSHRGLWVGIDYGKQWQHYYIAPHNTSPVDGLYVSHKTVLALGRDENGDKALFIQQRAFDQWKKISFSANAIFGDGGAIYLACDDGLRISYDGGQTWISKTYDKTIRVAAAQKNNYLMQTDGLHVSNDRGKSWRHVNYALSINDIAETSPRKIMAATNDGLRISDRAIQSWHSAFSGQPISFVKTSLTEKKIYVASDEALFVSLDDGVSWELLHKFGGFKNNDILTLYAENQTIAVGTANALYVSTDDGKSWNKKTDYAPVRSITGTKKMIYAG